MNRAPLPSEVEAAILAAVSAHGDGPGMTRKHLRGEGMLSSSQEDFAAFVAAWVKLEEDGAIAKVETPRGMAWVVVRRENSP